MDSFEWRQQAADALLAAGLKKLAGQLLACRDADHFSHVRVCGHNPLHYQRIVPFTCKLRICPTCNEFRKHRFTKRFLPPALGLLAAMPEYSAKFITLTTPVLVTAPQASVLVKQTAQAASTTIERVLRSHTDIASRAERAKGRVSFKRHGIGFVMGSEFGGEGNHLHHHVLFFGPDLPQPAVAQAWFETTSGLAKWAWINRAYTRREIKTKLEYTTKVTRLAPEFAPDLFWAYHGARRVQAYGALYGIGKTKALADERCPTCNSRVVDATRRSVAKWHTYSA